MPDFFEVILSQRACRSFSEEPVPDGDVERILLAATHAPSAENRQPWVFVVVRDADRRAAIGDLTRRAWRGGARSWSEARLSPGLLADVDRGAEGGVSTAPVLVVVCADHREVADAVVEASVFPAVQNLLLAATAMGLGSALTTLPTILGDELTRLLELPAHVRPLAVIPLGHPARPLGPPRRQPVATKTHREGYGAAW
jgi:nitroreductase